MTPKSPVVPRETLNEVIYAEHQDQYFPLPAVRTEDGLVLTRWRCSLVDRLRILFIGNVYHYQETFNTQMQPIRLESKKPEIVRQFSYNNGPWDWFRWAFNFNRKFGWIKTPRGWFCWDFKSGDPPRIYWSRDATPTRKAGVRVFLR